MCMPIKGGEPGTIRDKLSSALVRPAVRTVDNREVIVLTDPRLNQTNFKSLTPLSLNLS